jgi:Protein of unknown function (DUF1559)
MMSDIGIPELLILVAIATGLTGFQLGMPPRAEDPVLSRIAPVECVYYARHSGVRALDPTSLHLTERVQANPEIQKFVAATQSMFVSGLSRSASDPNDPILMDAEDLISAFQLLLRQPTAWYLSSLQIAPQEELDGIPIGPYALLFQGGMVMNLRESPEDLSPVIEKLLRAFLPDEGEIELDGKGLKRIVLPDSFLELWFKTAGDYFVLATSEAEVQALVARMAGDVPDWLLAAEKGHVIAQRSTLSYIRLDQLVEACRSLFPKEWNLEELGLESWQACISSSGFLEEVAASRVELVRKPSTSIQGVFNNNDAMSLESFDPISDDAMLTLMLRIDSQRTRDFIFQAMKMIQPRAWSEFVKMEDALSQEAGFKFDDMITALGDRWTLSASRGDGGIFTGWILEVSVRDPEKLNAFLGRFKQYAGKAPESGLWTENVEMSGLDITTLKANGLICEPSWCLEDETLVFSLYPQPLMSRLKVGKSRTGLAARAEIRELFPQDGNPPRPSLGFVGYFDMASIAEWLLPMAQMQVTALRGSPRINHVRGGVQVVENVVPTHFRLPSARALFPERRASTWTLRVSDQALFLESRSLLPQDNFGAAVPLALVLGIPMADMARENSRQAQSMQHMRQLMLAVLNHESASRKLPTCVVDKDHKPLLSWRVRLLPYLGEQQLYGEFKLDESWDSPHNRKLIARIPKSLRAPGTEADAGKTNYLGVAHRDGVFAIPEENKPPTRLRDIRDGTARTIAIVEVSDELAVVWTKPDDFIPDEEIAMRGLVGLRTDQFLAGFCDGHVQSLPESLEDKNLRGLFSKAGGEVVQLPDPNQPR